MFSNIGKLIILVGLLFVILGLIIWGLGKTGIPFGNLPGDIRAERKNLTFYFPIVSLIILSILLTIIVNVIFRVFKR